MTARTNTISYGPAGRSARRHARRTRTAAPIAIVRRILLVAVALAALATLNALAAPSHDAGRIAVVMDSSVAHDPARLAAAEAWLRRSGPAGAAAVAARVPAGPTQQLSVTSALAVRGYDTIVAIGLDPRIAIEPVVRRHADVRVVRWPGA
jgi:hypothetical protein